VSWRRRWYGDVAAKLSMDDMAQIEGLVAGQGDELHNWAWTIWLREEDRSLAFGREAEVVNPTLSEKANSIKYVRYPVGLGSL
jgi:hypothetical protein